MAQPARLGVRQDVIHKDAAVCLSRMQQQMHITAPGRAQGSALVDGDGRVLGLAEEERYSHVKHAWDTLPGKAVAFCLRQGGITWRELDVVAVGWDLRLLRPWSDADTDELYAEIFGPGATGPHAPRLEFVEHHFAHACSAFYASGFPEAGVLIADGTGGSAATSIFSAGHGVGLTLRRHWPRKYSLGTMYEAATRLLGFGGLEAGKTMGLAPYGLSANTSYSRSGTRSAPARRPSRRSATCPPARRTRT
jgi:carbamoyltransferase